MATISRCGVLTLLHVAVEYHELDAVNLLLRRGADLNARAEIGRNGVGGQTPLFHAIGANQGTGWETFEYLLDKGADLTVRARIQCNPAADDKVMDCVHKGSGSLFLRGRRTHAAGLCPAPRIWPGLARHPPRSGSATGTACPGVISPRLGCCSYRRYDLIFFDLRNTPFI